MATTFPQQVGATGFAASSASGSARSVAATAPIEIGATAPNYVAIYLSTIFAVSMLFLVGVGLPCAIFLDDYLAGFGLGAFCAAWGGPSFGVMAGSARVSTWFESHDSDLSPGAH